MDTTNTIELLNNTMKCTLGASSIHGVGIIAMRDIKEGEQLYTHGIMPDWYTLETTEGLEPDIKEKLLERWPLTEQGSTFLYPDVWLMSYMNHSDTPNSKDDIALKDIKKGEEITEDYRLMRDYKKIYSFLE